MRGEMKFMKRAQIYKASGVEFNPTSFEATSYDWWHFVRLINGKVVFNSYNYSQTTCKHQQKVRSLLNKLGIEIDIELKTRRSLNNSDALESAIKYQETEIEEIRTSLASPRRKKALDESRNATINKKLELINKIRFIMAGSKLALALK